MVKSVWLDDQAAPRVGGSFSFCSSLRICSGSFYRGVYKERPRYAWDHRSPHALLHTLGQFYRGLILSTLSVCLLGNNDGPFKPSSLPGGGFIVEFLGVEGVGGAALARFYGMHIGFFNPARASAFFFYRMGSNGDRPGSPSGINRNLWRNLVAAAGVTGLLLLGSRSRYGWFVDSSKSC